MTMTPPSRTATTSIQPFLSFTSTSHSLALYHPLPSFSRPVSPSYPLVRSSLNNLSFVKFRLKFFFFWDLEALTRHIYRVSKIPRIPITILQLRRESGTHFTTDSCTYHSTYLWRSEHALQHGHGRCDERSWSTLLGLAACQACDNEFANFAHR